MSFYKIPLTNRSEKFFVSLGIGTYRIINKWNYQSKTWEIDIFTENMDPLITSLPLVCGINLLQEHQHILPLQLRCYTDGDKEKSPTFDSLGLESNLYIKVNV